MDKIIANNLIKTYSFGEDQEIHALNGVSLEIEVGEFVAIVGPSGSGKSTLLHLLGGLDSTSSGSVLYGDHDIMKMSRTQRASFRLNHIGFIFQAYNLINVLTALENVEYIMALRKISKKERRKRSLEVLEQVGLEDFVHRRPTQLSGGQQQRVAVARALAAKPEVIFADEPTANLDTETSFSLMKLLHDLNQSEKATFVYSTHDPRMMSLSKRIIHVNDGVIDHAKTSVS